jgi:hypothetical protein
LNTDREIAPIVAQFVPVKLDVASDEYAQWRQDHPSEGNTIPKLFIVRADGETLYGRSGSLKGQDLPNMLTRALQNSGRILNAKEASLLTKAADEFTNLKQENQVEKAIKALGRVRKIGEPGKIPSYSQPASRVNQLAIETATNVKTELDTLAAKMDGENSDKLNAIMEYLRIKREYGALKLLKPELASFQKIHTGKANSQLTREAKIIDAAKTADSKSKRARALSRLNDLITKSEIEEIKVLSTQVKDGLTGEGESLDDL